MRINRRAVAGYGLASFATAIAPARWLSAQDHETATPTATDDDSVELGTGTGAIFMEIANTGDQSDTLISIETEAARIAEVHESKISDGFMTMTPVDGGVVVPPGEIIVFESGGFHVMLIDLNQSLNPDDHFEIILEFERAGTITLDVVVSLEAPEGDPIEFEGLEISGVYARPAPMISNPSATPEATPEHSGH